MIQDDPNGNENPRRNSTVEFRRTRESKLDRRVLVKKGEIETRPNFHLINLLSKIFIYDKKLYGLGSFGKQKKLIPSVFRSMPDGIKTLLEKNSIY